MVFSWLSLLAPWHQGVLHFRLPRECCCNLRIWYLILLCTVREGVPRTRQRLKLELDEVDVQALRHVVKISRSVRAIA